MLHILKTLHEKRGGNVLNSIHYVEFRDFVAMCTYVVHHRTVWTWESVLQFKSAKGRIPVDVVRLLLSSTCWPCNRCRAIERERGDLTCYTLWTGRGNEEFTVCCRRVQDLKTPHTVTGFVTWKACHWTLLTPWSSVFEKLVFAHTVQIFPTFYKTRTFSTLLTRTRHWNLSWGTSVLPTTFHPIFQDLF